MTGQLYRTMTMIEATIAEYYAFDLLATAPRHLVSRQQLRQVVNNVDCYPEWQTSGAVWLDEQQDDTVYISIHLDRQVIETIGNCDPYQALSNTNLNDFCVVVEEVSHFHLLVNKIHHGIALPKLELELQGEIDKILICAELLYRQTGRCHLPPLVRKICDEAHLNNDDDLYQQANRHVASFFYRSLPAIKHTKSEQLQRFLRKNYLQPWQDKVHTLLNDSLGIY